MAPNTNRPIPHSISAASSIGKSNGTTTTSTTARSVTSTTTTTTASRTPGSTVKRTFQPYANTPRDTALFQLIVGPWCTGEDATRNPNHPPSKNIVLQFLAVVYKIRWWLSYPLRTRLWPKFVPSFLDHKPIFKDMINYTIGDLLLCAPLLAFFIKGYSDAYIHRNTKDSGYMVTYAIFITYLTASKSNSFFSFFFGIPFERLIPLHMLASIVAVIIGFFHISVAHKTVKSIYSNLSATPDFGKFLVDGTINTSGSMAMLLMIFFVALSIISRLRRKQFNLWFFSHILMAFALLISMVVHKVKSTWFIIMWWGLDWLIRYAIMAVCRYRISKAQLRRVGVSKRNANEPAVEISFRKPDGFDYNPGQFVQICIPMINVFEFHPFSISSAPHEKNVTIHIRELGDWTTKLLNLIDTSLPDENNQVELWVEGPYGVLSVDLDDDQRYKMALCVSGGIGVTPCQSIGKSLLYQHRVLGRNLKFFKFVWAVRDVQMVKDLPPLGGTEDFSNYNILAQRQKEVVERSTGIVEVTDGALSRHDFHSKKSSFFNPSTHAKRPVLPAVIQCDIYCTKQMPEEEDGDLQYNFIKGRPDVDAIFMEVKATAIKLGETNIAVFGCGPTPLMEALEDACRKHSQALLDCSDEPPIFFDLHTELFDF